MGLPEAEIDFEDLQDPYGIEFWPEFKGRDGCRTPMVWQPDNRTGGFTTAAKGWLPVPAAHLGLAVAAQAGMEGSMLEHYRRILSFRRAHPALRTGACSRVIADGPVVRFVRKAAGTEVFCAVNLGDETVTIDAPEGNWCGIGNDLGSVPVTGTTLTLDAWRVCLALRA